MPSRLLGGYMHTLATAESPSPLGQPINHNHPLTIFDRLQITEVVELSLDRVLDLEYSKSRQRFRT